MMSSREAPTASDSLSRTSTSVTRHYLARAEKKNVRDCTHVVCRDTRESGSLCRDSLEKPEASNLFLFPTYRGLVCLAINR